MLAKRIIPCLDVKDNKVVKGTCFQNHRVAGEILDLAIHYCEAGADELVFYDITASSDARTVSTTWISEIAKFIDIPFCVAGGIKDLMSAEKILNAGADKISINSPALQNPGLIDELVKEFGQQCIVIGIDSLQTDKDYHVCQYTGDSKKMQITTYKTAEWIAEVQARGAGEIVLNCMNQDGKRNGYDLKQLQALRPQIAVPLIASGGAGCIQDFIDVFSTTHVNGALAASVFHFGTIEIKKLKQVLKTNQIEVRLC